MSDREIPAHDDLHVRMLRTSADVTSFLSWPGEDLAAMVEAGLRRAVADRDKTLSRRVGRLYPCYVEARPAAERRRLLREIAFEFEPLGPIPSPLLLWIVYDPAHEVVADATVLYAASHDSGLEDEVDGALILEDLVLRHGTGSMAGFLAGLVHLGDIRLIPALNRLRWLCTEDEVVAFCRRPPGVPTTTESTMLLGWMEETVEVAPERFGPLAARFADLAGWAPEMIHCRRAMPCTVQEALAPPDGDELAVLEYSTWIGERLEALAEREPEPRVMPTVLRAWGLGEPS